jgi:hypothetical protein
MKYIWYFIKGLGKFLFMITLFLPCLFVIFLLSIGSKGEFDTEKYLDKLLLW